MKYTYEVVKYSEKFPARLLLQKKIGSRCNSSLHCHKALEIIYVIKGTLSLEINSIPYTIKENDFIIVNSDVLHESISYDNFEIVYFLVLQLSYNFLKKFKSDIDYGYFNIDKNSKTYDNMVSILSETLLIIEEKACFYELKINSLLSDMAYLLLNNAWIRNENSTIIEEKNLVLMLKKQLNI